MNSKAFFTILLVLAGTLEALAWGQKGHDVVCSVAEQHLTKTAARKISAVLDGRSIVYWANWMDSASNTKEYSYTKTWHYRNIDAGQTLETAKREPKGDVLTAIADVEAKLRKGGLSKEEEALALKMLVHFVGDLHCPMHVGHLSDKGGNKWQVSYFGSGTNLHSVFDSKLVESAHKWSCSEWVKEIDILGRKEIAAITAGTPEDWCMETFEICTRIYDSTPVGSKLWYDFVSEWTPTIEDQLLKGGLRLASILNSIYK